MTSQVSPLVLRTALAIDHLRLEDVVDTELFEPLSREQQLEILNGWDNNRIKRRLVKRWLSRLPTPITEATVLPQLEDQIKTRRRSMVYNNELIIRDYLKETVLAEGLMDVYRDLLADKNVGIERLRTELGGLLAKQYKLQLDTVTPDSTNPPPDPFLFDDLVGDVRQYLVPNSSSCSSL